MVGELKAADPRLPGTLSLNKRAVIDVRYTQGQEEIRERIEAAWNLTKHLTIEEIQNAKIHD